MCCWQVMYMILEGEIYDLNKCDDEGLSDSSLPHNLNYKRPGDKPQHDPAGCDFLVKHSLGHEVMMLKDDCMTLSADEICKLWVADLLT